MSFIRCDQGATPSDHHTLAMALGAANRYVHSAFEVSDLDALAAGGEYLRDQGYLRSWGIGRHIQGSQIFDYWRDPTDSWSSTTPTETCSTTLSRRAGRSSPRPGLAQWGPPVTKDFLGIDPKYAREEVTAIVTALRDNNEFDVKRLMGMLKVARS